MQFCHFGASVWKRRTSWFLPRLTYKVYVPTLPNYCLLLPRSAAPESSEQMHTVSEAQTSVWLPPARDKYKGRTENSKGTALSTRIPVSEESVRATHLVST